METERKTVQGVAAMRPEAEAVWVKRWPPNFLSWPQKTLWQPGALANICPMSSVVVQIPQALPLSPSQAQHLLLDQSQGPASPSSHMEEPLGRCQTRARPRPPAQPL